MADPAIGHHDAARFVPFLWTMFFFILFCNLFGLLPWAGSPTASLSCTGALAIAAFLRDIGTGMAKFGRPWILESASAASRFASVLAIFLIPMIFVIEVLGIFIKHGVLAIRLLANMMAGHLVLAVILAFIAATAETILCWGVTASQRAGVCRAQSVGIAGGVYSSLCVHVFVGVVYRNGGPSALIAVRMDSPFSESIVQDQRRCKSE